jgi:hypothetical protein
MSPFQTRFRWGCATKWLRQARDGKSPDHYAKGTPSPQRGARGEGRGTRGGARDEGRGTSYRHSSVFSRPAPLALASPLAPRPLPLTPRSRALTACRHVVSGSLSSPHRGSSHLSLALLGSLSVAREYLALRDGPRRFGPASTCRVLLRCRIGGFPPSPTGLSPALVELSSSLRLKYQPPKHRSYNPRGASPSGLGYSAFARRY